MDYYSLQYIFKKPSNEGNNIASILIKPINQHISQDLWLFSTLRSKKPGIDPKGNVNAGEFPIVILLSGVASNWYGQTGAENTCLDAGKLVTQLLEVLIQSLTVRSCAVNVII